MTLFHYTAVNREGSKIEGQLEASDRQSVFEQLHEAGHLPVDVAELRARASYAGKSDWPFLSRHPSPAQITLFTRELAMLLKAGQTLDQALKLLEKDGSAAKQQKLIAQLRAALNDGKSFNEALAGLPQVFPAIYTNMIRVAEASGTLENVLEDIADTRERDQKRRAQALSAMLYPALLVLTAVGAVIIMLVFVVPRFKQMLVTASAELPGSTEFVIGLSDGLIAHGQWIAVGALAIVAAILVALRRPGVRRGFDGLLLHLPLIGRLMRLNLTIQFCRTLSTLLENGVELPMALNLTKDVLGNAKAKRALEQAYEALRKGQNFTDPLTRSGLFPPVAVNMLVVGEETGGLASSTKYLARMFEDKLELAITRLFTIIEPAIIILVSLFVAGIIISIIGAVISVNDLAL